MRHNRHYAEYRNMPHRVFLKLGSAFENGSNPFSLFGTHAA
jgi:hypothetical protein